METLKFITNINCGGCVAKVTPYLENLAGNSNWNVDTDNSAKLLTINTDNTLTPEKVIATLEDAGFTAIQI